ncbi:MAG: hypothetical protein KAY32_15970 [Candidatus Eisenbacteria sp.]|nr:hypothetical protein [Candidatus Eisenbacteria bacterium]
MGRTLRCRQCGWVVDLPTSGLPRYGARGRCGQCDTLLPLIESAAEGVGASGDFQVGEVEPSARLAADEPPLPSRLPSGLPAEFTSELPADLPAEQTASSGGRRAEQAPSRGDLPGADPLAACGSPASVDTALRLEARELIERWLEDLTRDETVPMTETILWGERGAELAVLVARWQASHPGREALAALREELFAATKPASRDVVR